VRREETTGARGNSKEADITEDLKEIGYEVLDNIHLAQ
jgi:hypothetical protein